MSSPEPGAKWIRAALQVNPYAYHGKNAPSISFSSEAAYNTALLDECVSLGVSVIAITDHWCVDSGMQLVDDARARGIVALPGFEANSQEGVHLLVIFESDTPAAKINAAIGACGVEPGCANGTIGIPFAEILDKMTELKALVIPAHVNVESSGMLTKRTGPPLEAMVKDPKLHAIAVTPSQPDGHDQALIIKGARPYDRKHPLAVIYADDISNPNQLKNNGATTWFKVSKPSVDSLKLAVRTPKTRVAIADPSPVSRTLIEEISWTGGFLDGVSLPVANDLTALIGGRGTGKSTVIESLRYVLGLVPIGIEAQVDHKSVIEKVVRSGTVISLNVQTVSPVPKRYTIERVVPNPPVVRDSGGVVTNLTPVDVVGSVEIFGQHELAELASNPKSIAEMLRRFGGHAGPDKDHEELLESLLNNRQLLERKELALAKLKDELDDVPRLEEQVKQFNETNVAKRLADIKRFTKDEAVFAESSKRVVAVAGSLAPLLDADFETSLESEFEDVDDSPRKELLARASRATATLSAKLKDLSRQAQEAIDQATEDVGKAKAEWSSVTQDQRDGHAEVLRQLHEDGLEPDRYLDTSRALERLIARRPHVAKLEGELRDAQEIRNALIGQLATWEKKKAKELNTAVTSANASTGKAVVVRPILSPDRTHVHDVIKTHTSGVRNQITEHVDSDGFSTRALAAAVRSGESELKKLGITGAQARGLVSAGEALCRQLEELSVGNAVEVLLDISTAPGRAELRKIDQLSKGQRATALLLLLLGASSAPLVIDQPEDDLDNRFVYEGVVTKLRDLKGVRQILASTHNANVPVLGDAELIIALEGDGQNGRPAEDGIGSLDDSVIRGLVEHILEGGPAAFNARQHLYGF